MHFCINKHAREMLDELNVLRKEGHLCDVNLRADADVYPAHRVVLAAASPYFKAMFTTTGMRECEMLEVPLQNVKSETLAMLINFAYTSELDVDEKNVCALLPAATMFQISHVADACSTFLEHQLDPSNCIGIADFASAHGCTQLYSRARDYIFQHFCEVSQTEEYLELSHSQLAQVVRRDELNVHNESEVFDAVLRWVKHDEERRRPRLDQLLAAVRFHFLPPQCISKLKNDCDILSRAPRSCVDLIERVLADLSLHKPVALKHRIPDEPKVVYIMGGYMLQSLGNVDSWNPDTGAWYSLASLEVPRNGLAACRVGNRIYVIGGRSNTVSGPTDCERVDYLDIAKNEWSRCSDMSVARNRLGTGLLDGLIYAVGGSSNKEHHSSVERYNCEDDTWSRVQSMSTARVGVGITVVNRLLYAVGGFDGTERLATVERYHPENNEWSPVASMAESRSGAGVCSLGQFIYAAGGYTSTLQLDSVERYNVKLDQWETLAPMLHPRSALCLTVVSDKLYAIGGYDGAKFLSGIERYDKTTNEWTEVANLSCGRSGHGVIVGSEPSQQYAVCLNT